MAFNLVLPAIAFTLTTSAAAESADLRVRNLRCEYLHNPLGIESVAPRLSWELESSRRGTMQKAYRVLVARTPGDLSADRGEVWDSGRVESDASVHVVYQGRPLDSGARVWWKVRIWTADGSDSGWSEPAWWETGLLRPGDWKGRWIGAEAPAVQPGVAEFLRETRWIWTVEGDPLVTTPAGLRIFRRTLTLPVDSSITGAHCILAADDTLTLYVNGKDVATGNWPEALRVDLGGHLHGGANSIVIAVRNLGGSAGLIGRIVVATEAGNIELATDKSWKAADKEIPGWTGPLDDSVWQNAREVATFGDLPWRQLNQPREMRPAPHLRRTFNVQRPIRSARAYVAGIGYHELYLNGGKVGDHVLDPAFTRYDRRVLYVTHDVTSLLKHGQNAVGVILGNGWYNHITRSIWNFEKSPWRAAPALLFQMRIDYEDGTHETIVSDDRWETGPGPILSDALFVGEVYDARRERPGWSQPTEQSAGWQRVIPVDGPPGRLSPQAMPPVRVVQTITPVKMTQPAPGVAVYDMGQAFSGWARLSVRGPAGTKVVLKYGERLNPGGTVRQDEIKPYIFEPTFQADTYILSGRGTEVWEPRFNYHGFRYVEVTGLPGEPGLDNISGRVIHTDYPEAGTFSCSNPLLNRIQHCTVWSYGANFIGYPTDCPHREKNGWTGDAHLAAEQAMFNVDNIAAYEKWMDDLFDEQRDSGELPGIVPTSGWGYHWGNGPAWDSAYVLIPWYLYQYAGDVRVLERHYDRMKRYVDYLTSRAKDGIVDFGLGDWVPAKSETPVAVTSTGYYYADTRIVAAAAAVLGKNEDAARYAELAGRIRAAFNKRFVNPETGQVANGTQTAQSCALYQGLADQSDATRILDVLVRNVDASGHLDTGILGAKYLLHALTDGGHADLAYRVVSQRTLPGWGYWIEQGATTLWEDWKGEASLIHIMLGDVSAWFYRALAGINPDPEQPGFRHIIIRPQLVGDLTEASAEYRSVRGLIRSAWKRHGGQVRFEITVPANATATLVLPCANPAAVTEGGARPESRPGITPGTPQKNRAVYELGSGTYTFLCPAP